MRSRLRNSIPGAISGGSGGGSGGQTLVKCWSGEITLTANQAWATYNTLYGHAFYQLAYTPGLNPPAPAQINYNGWIVPAGATLQTVRILGRTSNAAVLDIELYLRAFDADLTVATDLNSAALTGARTLLPATSFGIAGNTTHLRLAEIDIPTSVASAGDEVMLNTGLVVPFFRTSTSLGSSYTFIGSLELTYEL